MSRWRAPTLPSTALITREGLQRLRDELHELWQVLRPEVVRALSEIFGFINSFITVIEYAMELLSICPFSAVRFT